MSGINFDNKQKFQTRKNNVHTISKLFHQMKVVNLCSETLEIVLSFKHLHAGQSSWNGLHVHKHCKFGPDKNPWGGNHSITAPPSGLVNLITWHKSI